MLRKTRSKGVAPRGETTVVPCLGKNLGFATLGEQLMCLTTRILDSWVVTVTIPSSSAPTCEPPKDNIASTPENVEHQEFIVHDEEESPIRPDETPGDHYYRTYTERRAVDLHAPVWKLKQGDSFYDWQVCRDWFQGTFPPPEIKFQEEQTHDRTYRAYLQETVISTSTNHRIVHEWRSMHKEWDAVEASKKEVAEEKAKVVAMRTKLEPNQA
ncbi:hypothetical protein Hanom_Chr02g00125941 [Helianthus anomalus]